jgi:hypothetical protein
MVVNKRIRKVFLGICIIGLLTGLIHVSWGLGFALGAALSVLLWKRNESFWNSTVSTGQVGKGTGLGHFTLNYGIMAGAMILCVFAPEWLNVITCAIGLTACKMAVIFESVIIRGKEEPHGNTD